MLGLETALPVVATVMVESGRMTWADVARVMSADAGPDRRARRARARRSPSGSRPTSPWSTRARRSSSTATQSVVAVAQQPLARPHPGRVVYATFLRGVPTVLEGKLA